MTITRINVKKIDGHEFLKGVASIVFDDAFKVREIKILKGKDNELHVSMPNKELPNGTHISMAYPVSDEVRVAIENAIYKKALPLECFFSCIGFASYISECEHIKYMSPFLTCFPRLLSAKPFGWGNSTRLTS